MINIRILNLVHIMNKQMYHISLIIANILWLYIHTSNENLTRILKNKEYTRGFDKMGSGIYL